MEIPEMSEELKRLIGSFKICLSCAETERIQIVNDFKSSLKPEQRELLAKSQKISRYINLIDLHLLSGKQ